MNTVSIKSVTNGYVVTIPMTTPSLVPTGPSEYIYSTWTEVTAFLTTQGFILPSE